MSDYYEAYHVPFGCDNSASDKANESAIIYVVNSFTDIGSIAVKTYHCMV